MVTLLKHGTVHLKDVLASGGLRLDASVFNVEARHARSQVAASTWPLISVGNALVGATYPGRFKRIYVDKSHGRPFLLPSQILELRPSPTKWILVQDASHLNELVPQSGDILMTRSGTIGELSIATERFSGWVMSDDLIRLTPRDEYRGLLYAFFRTKIGQTILRTSNYGAVVQHIEPHHLSGIEVPDPSTALKIRLNQIVSKCFSLQDEYAELVNKAHKEILTSLKLPDIGDFKFETFRGGKQITTFVEAHSRLQGRLDGSFHHPLADAILKHLQKSATSVEPIGSAKVSKQVILPGRFKRVYVEEEHGVPFIGGKEIGALDPRTGKCLSLANHGERIDEELRLHSNMVLVTCSGTIGKATLVPPHWEGWAASQHIIRIVAFDDAMAAYLFAWLSTDYGRALVTRFSYGAVVDEIDDRHIAQVAVPMLHIETMQRISDDVLSACVKRNEAFALEAEAIALVESDVIGSQQAAAAA